MPKRQPRAADKPEPKPAKKSPTKAPSKKKAPTKPLTLDPLANGQPAPADSVPAETPSEAAIRARAYELWEAAGKPATEEMDFWLEAERQLARGK